jgi:DNA-binding transcriptional ArsR family regulator
MTSGEHDVSMATGAAATSIGLDDELLRLLAEPLRRQIVELLAGEQLCTCHLVELTGATQSNVSNHLRALREAGMVQADAAGRYTYYRLLPDRLSALGRALDGLAGRARAGVTTRRPCP